MYLDACALAHQLPLHAHALATCTFPDQCTPALLTFCLCPQLALPVLKAAAEQPPRKRSSTPAPSGQQLPPVTSKQELRGPTASSLTSATSKSDLGGVGDSGSSNAGNSAKPETAPSRLSVSSQPTTASGAAAQSVQLNAAVSTVQSTVQAQAEAGGDSTSLMEFEARCVASATREYELMTRLGRFRRRSLEAM